MPSSPSGVQQKERLNRKFYSNFKDPFGLASRLLCRGGTVGKHLVIREALTQFVKPLDYCLKVAERSLLTQDSKTDFPLLLIVGPPRSGTSLLHQVLASCLDVSYFTNFNAMFRKSPLSAAKYFQKRLDPGPVTGENLYGNTSGFRGVNDAFHVWNRYLGIERYDAMSALDSSTAQEMRQFFHAWTNITSKPLLNKNNRNLACTTLLSELLPRAHFIAVHREPVYVAQSLLKAREWVQGNRKIGWGLGSVDSSATGNPMDDVEAVCCQVAANESLLKRQRKQISSERWTDIAYESFCENPQSIVREICELHPSIKLRSPERIASLQPFANTNQDRLTEDEVDKIGRLLATC